MRAAIFNPYLDTLGGGERYTAVFAKVLAKNGYTVDVEWKDVGIIKNLENRFGTDLDGVNIVNDIKKGEGYDLCFWVSDGSIPMLHARNNILHFQVPFHNVSGRSLLNKMKLFRINKIVCNSLFTKKVIDSEYGVNSLILYPPIDTSVVKPKRKENLILSVGRFSQILQTKGQDILIKAFRKMVDEGLTDWKLILVGGVEVGAKDYVEKLRILSTGYPIEIIESPNFKTLKEIYGKSKIFWSASGFGENEEKNPQKVEHFGITVVEAMAWGVPPVVYAAGGHKEIIEEEKNGQLWKKIGELTKKTMNLIENPKTLREMASDAKKSSEKYSEYNFEKNIVTNLIHK